MFIKVKVFPGAKKECINFLKKLGVKNVEKNHIKKGYAVLLLEKKN